MAVGLRDDADGIPVHLLRHTAVIRSDIQQGGDPGEVFPDVLRLISMTADQVQGCKVSGADPAVTSGEQMPIGQAV